MESRFKLIAPGIAQDLKDKSSNWYLQNMKMYPPCEKSRRLSYRTDKWHNALENNDGYSHQDRVDFFNVYQENLFNEERTKIFKSLINANPLADLDTLWVQATNAAKILKENDCLGFNFSQDSSK